MKTKKILDAVALAAGVVTDGNITKIDFDGLGETAEFIVTGKAVGNTVSPGAARTITTSYVWSDEDLVTPVAADFQAGGRAFQRRVDADATSGAKAGTGIITLLTGASKTTYWEIFATAIRPRARYCYFLVTKTTEDAGAITTFTLTLTKLRSTARRF